MKRFKFREVVYEVVNRPTLGELIHVERLTKTDVDEMPSAMAALSGYYLAIRRGQLASGGDKLITWDELSECSFEDFEHLKEAHPIPEPKPEEEKPDPTAGERASSARSPRKRAARKSVSGTS